MGGALLWVAPGRCPVIGYGSICSATRSGVQGWSLCFTLLRGRGTQQRHQELGRTYRCGRSAFPGSTRCGPSSWRLPSSCYHGDSATSPESAALFPRTWRTGDHDDGQKGRRGPRQMRRASYTDSPRGRGQRSGKALTCPCDCSRRTSLPLWRKPADMSEELLQLPRGEQREDDGGKRGKNDPSFPSGTIERRRFSNISTG